LQFFKEKTETVTLLKNSVWENLKALTLGVRAFKF
jgi:hypothetical protein